MSLQLPSGQNQHNDIDMIDSPEHEVAGSNDSIVLAGRGMLNEQSDTADEQEYDFTFGHSTQTRELRFATIVNTDTKVTITPFSAGGKYNPGCSATSISLSKFCERVLEKTGLRLRLGDMQDMLTSFGMTPTRPISVSTKDLRAALHGNNSQGIRGRNMTGTGQLVWDGQVDAHSRSIEFQAHTNDGDHVDEALSGLFAGMVL